MKQEIAQPWSSWDSRGAWIFCLDVGLLLPHLFPTGTHKLQVVKNVLTHITHYFDLWHLKKSTVHFIYMVHDYIVLFVFLQTIIIVLVGLFEIIFVFHVSLF